MALVSARSDVRVTPDPIDAAEILSRVADPKAGGTCLFLGTVRDHSAAGSVTGITYEAWEDEALRRLEALAAELIEHWPLCAVAIDHRFGDLAVGAASVAVACSAPHRAEAFEACREGIERLKVEMPIWKKEQLASGDAAWVEGS